MNDKDKVPDEIPTHKHPDKQPPTKDPLQPNETNPINPKEDDGITS